MPVKRGEVLLAYYPFASGSGGSLRPVLVVQNDRDNARMTNTIVAQITSNLLRAGEPTQLLIEMATPEGQQSGLLHDSLVSCNNLATIDSSRINRPIGSLPPAVMQKVNDCLKAALELP